MKKSILLGCGLLGAAILIATVLVVTSLTPPQPIRVKTGVIPAGTYDPAKWGQLYPLEYDSWKATQEPRPANKSKYKKGWDTDKVVYDKLSEFPYMALLFKGWGFGQEYNEPRGHYFMMTDIAEIDKSRTGAGGVCLTCKTPYISKLVKENGAAFHSTPFFEARAKIPPQHRELGVTCFDCHDNETMDLKVHRWTIQKGLQTIGHTQPSHQDMRSIVCAACHVSYSVKKDAQMKSIDVVFPWEGSQWGNISIENIIKVLRNDPSRWEWTQQVTGFKLAFIRHPEFEFFSKGSVHWKAGVACSDCHMPYKRVGANKISDHNVMSPLKNDLRACIHCHPQTPAQLKDQVITIQERTVALLNRSGYATATVAKLFEMVHQLPKQGPKFDQALYQQAKDYYLEAFYRVVFLGAENSVGFHNPSEAGRIAADAIAFATKAEALLRQGLTQAGVKLPRVINLELGKYVNKRGIKEKKGQLNFKPAQEIKDPTGIQAKLLPAKAKGL